MFETPDPLDGERNLGEAVLFGRSSSTGSHPTKGRSRGGFSPRVCDAGGETSNPFGMAGADKVVSATGAKYGLCKYLPGKEPGENQVNLGEENKKCEDPNPNTRFSSLTTKQQNCINWSTVGKFRMGKPSWLELSWPHTSIRSGETNK
jgi:hypothetical protein